MISSFAIRCIMFSITGFILGLLIDYTLHKFQKKYDISPLALIVLQLFVLIMIFYYIENHISNDIIDEIQSSIAGLFFIFMYFNAQINLNDNIKALIYNNKLKIDSFTTK